MTAVRNRLPKASDWLVSRLRSEILTNGFSDGHRLPSESDLTEQFGASRTAVREALRILEVEGLIEIRRGRTGGTFVRHPDTSTVARSMANVLAVRGVTLGDFVDFRRLLEPLLASAAAKHASADQAQELLRLAQAEAMVPVGDIDVATTDFHTAVAQCTNNAMNQVMLESLGSVLDAHVRTDAADPADIRASQAAHERIARAIVAGDAEAAARHMDRHLVALGRFVERIGQTKTPVILDG